MPPAILITMPHSHYAEKARWALDRRAVSYREEPHVPLFHRLATRRHGGGSVPVLAHGDGRFTDSTGIVMHADTIGGGEPLYPQDPALRSEVVALEERFDEELGPHTRRWAYAQLLPEPELLRPMMSRGVPWHEARLLPLFLPRVLGLIQSRLKITPESATRSLAKVREVFRETEQRLVDGRRYLAGDRFSAADLTFAALASPVLLPARCGASYPPVEAVPMGMREEILRLRDTAAGRFALRIYEKDRASP